MRNNATSVSIKISCLKVITNVDIPYFEGMQSVKMPVLTTTGKNLFDGNIFKNQWMELYNDKFNYSYRIQHTQKQ